MMESEARPYCPRCNVAVKLQIKGVSPEQSQYKCPECGKTMQGAACVWR